MKKLVSVLLVLVCLMLCVTAIAESNFTPLVGTVISKRAGVRSETDEELEPFKFFKYGEKFKIVGETGDWFIISDDSTDGGEGYMLKKLIVTNPMTIRTTDMVDVYAAPYLDKCVKVTGGNEEYTVILEYNEYYCISTCAGGSGFVRKDAAIVTNVQE
jgi:SH3-like domain-containing protein